MGLVVLALVIALLIKTFLFQAFYIPSESMTPTLKIHDRVLVNKLSYKLHPVHRGDIVVFKAPPHADPGIDDLVKRVVGLPGETVAGHGGHVYINGKQLPEKYLPDGVTTSAFGPENPDGLLLGDGGQPRQLEGLAIVRRHHEEPDRRSRVPPNLAAQPHRHHVNGAARATSWSPVQLLTVSTMRSGRSQ